MLPVNKTNNSNAKNEKKFRCEEAEICNYSLLAQGLDYTSTCSTIKWPVECSEIFWMKCISCIRISKALKQLFSRYVLFVEEGSENSFDQSAVVQSRA